MTGIRESDNHEDGRQAKRPRLQTGRGRASSSHRGRGWRARVPTDPPPAENQQGKHTIPMQAQSNDINIAPAPAVTDSTSVDLTRYKTWRGAGSPHDNICFECYQPLDLYPAAHVKGRTMILANQRTVSCAKMMRIYGIALFVWIVVGIRLLLR